jgi:hypothetical protein
MVIDMTEYGSDTLQGRHRLLHAQRGTHLADILDRGPVELCMLKFITIYDILCLQRKEAPRRARVRFTDVQGRRTEFLDLVVF